MPHRLNSFFTGNPELRELMLQAKRLVALERRYRDSIPEPLAKASRVIGMERQTLVIGAANSAVAAKLRHLFPNILSRIQEGNREITGIRVKVQVDSPSGRTEHPPHPLSDEGRLQIEEFASTLKNSPLKQALQRLTRR